jgi:hypothetical protein
MIFKRSSCKTTTTRIGSTTVSVLSLIGVSLVALLYFVTWPTARNEVFPKLASSFSERLTYEGEPKSIPPIELGIVPADESRRLLFPFSRLGIPEDADIESITTSCECIHASVLTIKSYDLPQSNPPKRLIAVEHHPEQGKEDATPMSLRVECTVHLSDSKNRVFTVDFDSIRSIASVSQPSEPKALEASVPEPMARATDYEGTESISDRMMKYESSSYGSAIQEGAR